MQYFLDIRPYRVKFWFYDWLILLSQYKMMHCGNVVNMPYWINGPLHRWALLMLWNAVMEYWSCNVRPKSIRRQKNRPAGISMRSHQLQQFWSYLSTFSVFYNFRWPRLFYIRNQCATYNESCSNCSLCLLWYCSYICREGIISFR